MLVGKDSRIARGRLGLVIFVLMLVTLAHGEDGNFTDWAKVHACPLSSLDPTSPDSEWLPLKSAIGSAHLVGLGEPIHNAQEPLALRNRLFRFLVERMGFTAIALETGFTDSLSAYSFIAAGHDAAETAALRDLTMGYQFYVKNQELMRWMRDYNAAAAAAGHRRIRLYGIDLPGGGRPSAPRHALTSALTYLASADPTIAQRIRASLSEGLPSNDEGGYHALRASAEAEFETDLTTIAEAIQKNRKKLIAHSSDEQYRWAVHNLDNARQLTKCLPLTPPPGAQDAKAMNAWVISMACRDSAMAKNVQWALEQEGSRGRLFVFAHNGHVMSYKEDGDRWALARDRPPAMGLFLRQVYGNDFYVIAMSAATATGNLPTRPDEPDSIERPLMAVGMPLMFLDIRQAQRDKDVLAWLSTPRSFNSNLQTHGLATPSTALDAFFFVNTLTPAPQSSR